MALVIDDLQLVAGAVETQRQLVALVEHRHHERRQVCREQVALLERLEEDLRCLLLRPATSATLSAPTPAAATAAEPFLARPPPDSRRDATRIKSGPTACHRLK